MIVWIDEVGVSFAHRVRGRAIVGALPIGFRMFLWNLNDNREATGDHPTLFLSRPKPKRNRVVLREKGAHPKNNYISSGILERHKMYENEGQNLIFT